MYSYLNTDTLNFKKLDEKLRISRRDRKNYFNTFAIANFIFRVDVLSCKTQLLYTRLPTIKRQSGYKSPTCILGESCPTPYGDSV